MAGLVSAVWFVPGPAVPAATAVVPGPAVASGFAAVWVGVGCTIPGVPVVAVVGDARAARGETARWVRRLLDALIWTDDDWSV
ncbi:hypothetical protein ABZ801_37550 [Actinomadura sp. NPDC047616]|uniref:hypothetical protein n=1 Tax=Actinomadura sp. NPDC047616 TaxID=3155914 RepID=UPI0033C20116